MRVVHVVPTRFGSSGLFGGGERYPLELARAMACEVECELITFGPRAFTIQEPGGLRVRVLRPAGNLGGHPAHPVAPGLPAALLRANADIVHTHHMRSLPGRAAAVIARLTNRKLVVTDHGLAGGDWLGLLPRLFHCFLAVSAYSARELHSPPCRTRIIYGGADPLKYAPDATLRRDGALFVGRITPHKGIDQLIAALPMGARLMVAGSEGHDPDLPERDYPRLLRRLAWGRDVHFLGPVSDSALPALYRQASVLVASRRCIAPSTAARCVFPNCLAWWCSRLWQAAPRWYAAASAACPRLYGMASQGSWSSRATPRTCTNGCHSSSMTLLLPLAWAATPASLHSSASPGKPAPAGA